MNVYRATIDNDMYKKEDWMNKYFIQKPVEETEYVSCLKEDDKVIVGSEHSSVAITSPGDLNVITLIRFILVDR